MEEFLRERSSLAVEGLFHPLVIVAAGIGIIAHIVVPQSVKQRTEQVAAGVRPAHGVAINGPANLRDARSLRQSLRLVKREASVLPRKAAHTKPCPAATAESPGDGAGVSQTTRFNPGDSTPSPVVAVVDRRRF